jgi:septal ring factor EnvC (AmiA/AmiB activator)
MTRRRLPLDRQAIVRVSQGWDPPTHCGIDYSCYMGTPVYAPCDGQAYPREQAGGFGRYVVIETEAYRVYTAHLSACSVGEGEQVKAGQRIGLSGNTGQSSGPHLHFEVRAVGGSPYLHGAVDPDAWLAEGEERMEAERERIVAARWHVEEAVRQIETTIAAARTALDDLARGLEQARERLVQEAIPRLYEAAGEERAE